MDERFGRYIKSIRRRQGIAADEIGSKLNMPSMLWLDIENGELKPPRLGKLFKLSEILHLSANEREHMLLLAGNEMEAVYEGSWNNIPALQDIAAYPEHLESIPHMGLL